MKNPFITLLTALIILFSAYVYAVDDHSHDHQHEERDSHKKHII